MKRISNPIVSVFLVALYLCFLIASTCLAVVFIFNQMGGTQQLVSRPDPNCVEADCLQACVRELPDISGNDIYTSDELYHELEFTELARYRQGEIPTTIQKTRSPVVADYLKPLQDDIQLHENIWAYYQTAFPQDQYTTVSYMIIYTDGTSGTYAQVWELGGKWQLYIDIADYEQPEAIDSLVHEYGHIITLNSQQAREVNSYYDDDFSEEDFQKMDDQCSTFFDGYSCAHKGSYLNEFGELFWADIYDEWKGILIEHWNDEAGFEDATYEFYRDHASQFVGSYAATNPEEDIAESWTAFVLNPKPDGESIADQKVRFFYQFPELVTIREQIISNTCRYAAELQVQDAK